MTHSNTEEEYEECVVTFIDVLGFRSLLSSAKPSVVKRSLELLRRSTASNEPIERSDRMKYYRVQSEVVTENISDAVVRARTKNTQFRDGSLFWEILDITHAQIGCLSNDVLIRGAITLGSIHIGLNGEGPVFGPALAEAYDLERKDAKFPRVIIDKKLIDALSKDRFLRREGHSVNEEKEYFQRFTSIDEDGNCFIDYLKGSLSECDSHAHYLNFLETHRGLIERGLRSGLEDTIVKKYTWLRDYHNRHIAPIIHSYEEDAEARNAFAGEYGEDAASYFANLLISDS